MPKFTVYYTKIVSIGVEVEAEDYEAAIEAGHNQIPQLSAQASGWGQRWSREENEEAEPDAVFAADGDEVWGTDEHWVRVHREATIR